MNKKMRNYVLIGTGVWVLGVLIFSFHDFRYGLKYHFLNGRVEVEYRQNVETYEQAVQEGEKDVRKLLSAARRYDKLTYLSLARKRGVRERSVANNVQDDYLPADAQSAYKLPQEEMAALEAIYGKATLRKYREQTAQTEQQLIDEMRARLIVPKMKEPRLAAVLFNMFGLPVFLLAALLAFHEWKRRFIRFRL
jgi:hypothetical protein